KRQRIVNPIDGCSSDVSRSADYAGADSGFANTHDSVDHDAAVLGAAIARRQGHAKQGSRPVLVPGALACQPRRHEATRTETRGGVDWHSPPVVQVDRNRRLRPGPWTKLAWSLLSKYSRPCRFRQAWRGRSGRRPGDGDGKAPCCSTVFHSSTCSCP